MHPQTLINQSKSQAGLLMLATVAVIWFSVCVNAAEMVPSPVEPEPFGQPFEPINPTSQFHLSNTTQISSACAQQQKSWLGWLTDFSRKPANFHYIDFIELFY